MTARFASNLLVLLAGCFLATAAFAFGPYVVSWLGFGVGSFVCVTILLAFATSGRGLVQRALDCVVLLISAWTIVASRSFAGDTVSWLMFSSAATLVLLAVQGLIAHEVVLEISLRRFAEAQAAGEHAAQDGPLRAEPPPIRVAG